MKLPNPRPNSMAKCLHGMKVSQFENNGCNFDGLGMSPMEVWKCEHTLTLRKTSNIGS